VSGETDTCALNIERDLADLSGLQSEKWRQYGEDVIPAFVAEMDFSIAEPIRQALTRRLQDQDFGYPLPEGRSANQRLADAYATRMHSRFGWTPDPSRVVCLGDLVQGLYATVLAFTEPGDGVIVLEPSYPRILSAVEANQRTLLPLRLRDNGQCLAFDPDELETLAASARMLILCNPHNPSGRVFSREELLVIGACAERHDLIVVVDEVHADLVYDGHVHIAFSALSPALADRTVSLYSATKSFNLPGLRCAFAAFGSAALFERFSLRIPPRLLGDPNVFGMDATLAAWEHGDEWFSLVRSYLQRSRDHILKRVAAELPGISLYKPEATYLAWLDCSALEFERPAAEFFLKHARVALSPGRAFMRGGENWVRLNFATSTTLIDRILDQMASSLKS
jgi:cystathionine beta-lyase